MGSPSTPIGSSWAHAGVLGTLLMVSPAVSAEIDPARLTAEIAAVGPRVPGSRAHREAVGVLLEAMRSAGLADVASHTAEDHPDLVRLEGVLTGESGREILLTAHIDTVVGSPGAADNAAGCAVLVATAARLAEMPRRHRVRVVLFDGEERGLDGSKAWANSLDIEERAAVLAAVNLDLIGWSGASEGAVLTLLVEQGGHRRLAPGWLVGAALEAGRSVDRPLAVSASSGSLVAQVLTRALFLRMVTDADALLAAGVPAITLSESDIFRTDPENHRPGDIADRLSPTGLDQWVDRVAALALRLDTLAGRPRDDDQYLALFGRVWSRRDLYWLGLAVWVVLVFQGLPGAWRGALAVERGRKGQAYLPGFALRFLFLGCLLMLPVFTVVLLVPAAVVLLLPGRLRITPRWKLTLACAPLLVVLVSLVRLTSQGQVESFALGLPAVILLTAAFGSILPLLAADSREPAQATRVSSPSVDTAETHSCDEL